MHVQKEAVLSTMYDRFASSGGIVAFLANKPGIFYFASFGEAVMLCIEYESDPLRM